MVMGEAFPFVLIVNDPAGNSFVENLFAPKPDPNMKVSHFNRFIHLLFINYYLFLFLKKNIINPFL